MSINKNKIKAIAFDFGGVISINEGGNILRLLAEAFNLPFEDFIQTYFKYNHLANVHNMLWEDMVIKAVKTFDSSQEIEEKARHFIRKYESKNVINTELLKLISLLRKAGFKVAIFSNAGMHLRAQLEKKGIARLIDEIIISGEIGHQKPYKEAFQILFDRLDLQSEEVVFVDDSKKSLEKASEIGYIPVLFTNNQKLLLDLKNLGLQF